MLTLFTVNQPDDWNPVATHLLALAANAPLAEADSVNYSPDEATALARTERMLRAGRLKEAVQYSAPVIYKRTRLLSLILTIEPTSLHLSMVEVIPNTHHMRRVIDPIAQEATQRILGACEERHEGSMPAVRHFYRAVSPSA